MRALRCLISIGVLLVGCSSEGTGGGDAAAGAGGKAGGGGAGAGGSAGTDADAAADPLHIGRPCQLGVDDDAGTPGGPIATITSPALECPTRICILPGAEKVTDTSASCTASCTSDTDCANGELGDPNDPSDPRCKGGFVCAVATTAGDFCCRKLCICVDFVNVPAGGFQTPASCTPDAGNTCQNI
jgi:hypothetical protein